MKLSITVCLLAVTVTANAQTFTQYTTTENACWPSSRIRLTGKPMSVQPLPHSFNTFIEK